MATPGRFQERMKEAIGPQSSKKIIITVIVIRAYL
jgi:hypothetical protein